MRPNTARAYHERILRVLVHIQRHLDDEISLEDLARVAHFSPFHFHRIFRGMVGESVHEHVRRLRLERAAHRLRHGEQPVTRIALEAGYEAHEAFTRAFGAMFGSSPSQYREARGAPPLPTSAPGVHFTPGQEPSDFVAIRGDRDMQVRIEKVPAMKVVFMRHVGPYDQVGRTWGKLMQWAGARGLLGSAPTMIGIVHDDPQVTPPDKVRYDACLVADPATPPEAEVGTQEVGGGDHAITTHHGPYDRLGDTYAQLCGQWLPQSGRELRSAPPFEIYRNSPMDTPPEQLRTVIYLPLEPRR